MSYKHNHWVVWGLIAVNVSFRYMGGALGKVGWGDLVWFVFSAISMTYALSWLIIELRGRTVGEGLWIGTIIFVGIALPLLGVGHELLGPTGAYLIGGCGVLAGWRNKH